MFRVKFKVFFKAIVVFKKILRKLLGKTMVAVVARSLPLKNSLSVYQNKIK